MRAIKREDEKLAKVQLSLTEMGQRIEALRTEREQKIAAVDLDLPSIARIDQEVSELSAHSAILQQREVKLRERAREHERARRVEEKKAAIADVEKRLARRSELARTVDQALSVIESTLPELFAADDAVYRNWSDTLMDARLLAWTRLSTIRDLSSRPPQQPLHAGILQTIAGHGTYNLAEQAEQHNRDLIEELRKAAIPETDIDTEAA